jgi:hypothetical protein
MQPGLDGPNWRDKIERTKPNRQNWIDRIERNQMDQTEPNERTNETRQMDENG